MSVVFGRSLVRTADRWAALRTGDAASRAAAPPPAPSGLPYEWRLWGRAVLAGGLAAGVPLWAAGARHGRPTAARGA